MFLSVASVQQFVGGWEGGVKVLGVQLLCSSLEAKLSANLPGS